jgi:DNA-binding response OmpR family regulator
MTDSRPRTVLLYSDKAEVRDQMRLAIGTHPATDVTVHFVDASSYQDVFRLLDDTEVDVLVLDGEAQPGGGLGIARQLRDEYPAPPPVAVVVARAADRWLAAYARVDATLMHPLDPIITGEVIAGLIRSGATAA